MNAFMGRSPVRSGVAEDAANARSLRALCEANGLDAHIAQIFPLARDSNSTNILVLNKSR